MPMFCCVVGCHSKGGRDDVKFYSLPAGRRFKHAIEVNFLTHLRRKKWLNEIDRIDWTENKLKRAFVCSKHFISGKPASLRDITDPDWIPCQNLGPTNGPRRKGIRNKGVPNYNTKKRTIKAALGGRCCSVVYCGNTTLNTLKKGLVVRFHHFPKDPLTRKKWIKYCHRSDKINPKYATICSDHFLMNDYSDALMAKLLGFVPTKLKKDAVPSLQFLIEKSDLSSQLSKPGLLVPERDKLNVEELKNPAHENIKKSLRERINRCYVCLSRDRQMFNVPCNPDIRSIWAKSLSSTTVFPNKKTLLLCQDHFEKSDIIEDDHGNKNLRKNAVPVYLYHENEVVKETELEKNFFQNLDDSDNDENNCKKTSCIVRCTLCFKLTVESDAVALLQNNKLTQFGSILVTVLNAGSTEISSSHCCVTCSKQVLYCFELIVDVNVSAFLASRRHDNYNMEEILEKGCDKCNTPFLTTETLTDHFMEHTLSKNTLNNINISKIKFPEQSYEEKENNIQVKKKARKRRINIEKMSVTMEPGHKEGKNIKKKRLIDKEITIEELIFPNVEKEVETISIRNSEEEDVIAKNNETRQPEYIPPTYDGINDDNFLTEHSYGKDPTTEGALNCTHCNANFTRRDRLFYHCVMLHALPIPDQFSIRENPWSCTQCDKKFNSLEELKAHGSKLHSSKKVVQYQCEMCETKCLSLHGLQNHVRLKHDRSSYSYDCDLCLGQFSELKDYVSHAKNDHDIDIEHLDDAKQVNQKRGKKSKKIETKLNSQNVGTDESSAQLVNNIDLISAMDEPLLEISQIESGTNMLDQLVVLESDWPLYLNT